MTYKLYAVRIFTFKFRKSKDLYEKVVGFPVVFTDEDSGSDQFDLGTAHIGVERCDPNDPEAAELVGRFVGISIKVEDIEACTHHFRGRVFNLSALLRGSLGGS